MQNVLLLVTFVALAYVLAHRVVENLQRKFLVSNGAEYILIGLLLGPAMPWPPAIDEATLQTMSPMVTLAIGWVGLIYGMQANLRTLVTEDDGSTQLGFWEWGVTGIVVAGGIFLLTTTVLPHPTGISDYFMPLMLAASATVGSAGVVDVVRTRFKAEGKLTEILVHAARIGELLAIVTFGVLIAVYHPAIEAEAAGGWNYANWLLLTVGLGAGLGVLFRLFIGNEHAPDKQFLALLGIVVFASGAAFYLRLSPLLVNLTLGVVLANMAPNAKEILATLERFHKPMNIFLLGFAGLLWRLPGLEGWGVAGAYVILRLLGKLLGGWGAAASMKQGIPREVGRGLFGHGEVAVAMAISTSVILAGEGVAPSEVIDTLVTAILLSIILNEIWAARFVRALLIDKGEITPDHDRAAFRGEVQEGA